MVTYTRFYTMSSCFKRESVNNLIFNFAIHISANNLMTWLFGLL